MKKLIYTASLLILLSHCNTPGNTRTHYKELTDIGRKMNMDKAVTYGLITVEIGTPKTNISVSEEHLYGKFFHDRAEFYIVEQPQLFVAGAEVKRLTLYFIDGILCKKKYELTEDIGPDLMKSYGGFKFKALNEQTRVKSRNEKIVVKSDKGKVINSQLSRYQMKWKEEEEVMIRYQVHRDSLEAKLALMEELTAYTHLLRKAEREI